METGFTALPRYARIGTAAALAASLLLALRLSWLGPRMRELDGKRTAVAGREAELTRARREQADLAHARDRVDDLTLRLDRLGAVGSGEDDVSPLPRRLRALAVQSGLTVRALRPHPAVEGDLHAERSFGLRLDGTYQGLVEFFARVGGLSRIVTIEDVVVRAVDSRGSDHTIAAACTATVFVPLDPPGSGVHRAEEEAS